MRSGWGMSIAAMHKRIKQLHKGGMGMLKIGRELGVGTGFVQRVFERPSLLIDGKPVTAGEMRKAINAHKRRRLPKGANPDNYILVPRG